MALGLMTLEEYLYRYATSHWFDWTYNLVILSPVYEQTNDLTDMMRIYSKLVWDLIICSIFVVTIVAFILNILKGFELIIIYFNK